jgi:hypothetical protein
LHDEELHDLYSSINITGIIKSRRMCWAGHVARMGQKRNVNRLLVGKSEGKRPLGRPRRRWIDNIKMDILKIALGGVNLTLLPSFPTTILYVFIVSPTRATFLTHITPTFYHYYKNALANINSETCNSINLRSMYSPRYHILRYAQSIFLRECDGAIYKI